MKSTIQIRQYLDDALRGFEADPPDTGHQRGYLAALTEVRNWIETDTAGPDRDDVDGGTGL
jgi:hypothetical protein